MPDGYDVVVDELRGHAARLDGLQDRLDTALQAANQVHMGSDAYGVICQFFVPIVNAVSTPGVDAIRDAAGTVDATAHGVRATAGGYENTERANTSPFAGGAL